ncbi:lipid A deacylase LpxR family protein [Zavarzinia compransoris]|uniref:lipid A deacylase LpxR family protein n=1 Tax=Zavarzinia marina TaxID=2911065 RepID=UPI001F375F7C|nr:lipid A deacylase LpxR family protein [Zavarzinia marina]MCF4164222.1 lipid A deacylase LpxR family protein [Zavarzinia marina]
MHSRHDEERGRRARTRHAVLAPLLLPLCVSPALAQESVAPLRDPNGTLTFQIENDTIADTDRYYTNGAQISWLSPSSPPSFVTDVGKLGAFLYAPESQLRWGFGIGQMIFTPEDTSIAVPDPADRPYAGYLFGSVSFLAYTEEVLNTFELQFGVVGPSALGEQIQNTVHDIINDNPARGWDHQLKDEAAINLTFDRKWRAVSLTGETTGIGIDVTPNVTVAVGNVSTYAAAGLMLRLGQNLRADFGAPRIRPALAGTAFYDKREGFGWYLFGGISGRVVLRDIFLDGNTFRDGPSVDKRPLVGDLQAGAAVFLGATRLTYSYVLRSEEFEGQKNNSAFGALSLSWSF